MNISRRVFLTGSASLIVTAPMISNAFSSTLTKKNLVVVMLRGGMDGLTAVPFIGNNILAEASRLLSMPDWPNCLVLTARLLRLPD